MANAIYVEFTQSQLQGDTNISLNVDTAQDGPYCSLLDTGTYTFSQTHDFANDLSGVVGTDQRITVPTVADGLFDGVDLTYTAVSGNSIEAFALYRHNSGASSTWRLISFHDTGVTGLPLTPNGGNITVTWNASGIIDFNG